LTRPQRVAVTGMGCISAAAPDLRGHAAVLERPAVHCAPVPAWLFPTTLPWPVFAAAPDPVSPAARDLLASAGEDWAPSRTVRLAATALAEALEMAELDRRALASRRVGVVMGTTVGCTFNDEAYYLAWRGGGRPDLAPVTRYLSGNLAAAVHALLGTHGPAAVVTNACASGSDAIGLGREWIAAGRCDLVIAGGADELSRVAYNGFASLQLADAGPCRPFDGERRGLNLGEGAGIVILESAQQAGARGVEPLGWVRGYGAAADAWHPTAPHPEARGLRHALDRALADAGTAPVEIALVNAHGTATPANDLAEARALAATLPLTTPVVSTKGMTGHTLGAAGAIEAILTLLALGRGETCGTVGCGRADPELPFPPLPEAAHAPLAGRLGISQSLAFGGCNAALVLEAAA